MRLIKIGLASVNTTVGAFASNTDTVIAFARQIAEQQCTVGCFQEQVIGGYPAEDLVQWRSFVEQQWTQLARFAAATGSFATPTVYALGVTAQDGGHLYNCVAVVANGRILGIVPKEKLPTYGVFYENRTFTHGVPGMARMVNDGVPFGDMIFRFPFGTVAVEVCEDIWSPDGPMRRRCYGGAELVVNASASPWRAGVDATRREMIATRAGDNQATVVYVNQVGGNDSLVFDGGGYVCQNGRMLAAAPRWREGLATQVVDLDRTSRQRRENTTWRTDCEQFMKRGDAVRIVESGIGLAPNRPGFRYPAPANRSFFIPAHDHDAHCPASAYFDDLIEAMIIGLDYFAKTKAFDKIGIALSGGKDSVLTLLVAWLYARRRFENDAQRIKDFIHCFSMPTRFNSDVTRKISRRLCRALWVDFKEIPIEDAFDRETAAAQAMLAPGEALTPITLQNIQARIRGARMWNWANSSRGFWLQTSNMSEKAVGYSTVGGDLMGAFSLIANLPKTAVIELIRHIAEKAEIREYHAAMMIREVIDSLLATKASAELAAGQADENDLMPFPVLDACFALFAGEKMAPVEVYKVVSDMWTYDELIAMDMSYKPGTIKAWVKKFVLLFQRNIFKWVLTPEAVHLGALDLDRERALQLPVVQSPEWLDLAALDAAPISEPQP